MEGWADFLALCVAPGLGIADPRWDVAKDANCVNWRGLSSDDSGVPGPTGYDPATFESGEEVEGAVSGVYWDMGSGSGGLCFADVFKVYYNDNIASLSDFRQHLASNMGSGTTKTKAFYELAQKHGIVFSRARFKGRTASDSPFREFGPSGTTPNTGNRRLIDGIEFLRGTVHARFEPGATGVASQVTIDKVGFAATAGAAGLTMPAAAAFGGWVNRSVGEIEWDTVAAGPKDADCDLTLSSRNVDGFQDDFKPSWTGDGNPDTATDELAMKVFGAWFDQDANPKTPATPAGAAGKEGMVITDNTAPVIVSGTTKP